MLALCCVIRLPALENAAARANTTAGITPLPPYPSCQSDQRCGSHQPVTMAQPVQSFSSGVAYGDADNQGDQSGGDRYHPLGQHRRMLLAVVVGRMSAHGVMLAASGPGHITRT